MAWFITQLEWLGDDTYTYVVKTPTRTFTVLFDGETECIR